MVVVVVVVVVMVVVVVAAAAVAAAAAAVTEALDEDEGTAARTLIAGRSPLTRSCLGAPRPRARRTQAASDIAGGGGGGGGDAPGGGGSPAAAQARFKALQAKGLSAGGDGGSENTK